MACGPGFFSLNGSAHECLTCPAGAACNGVGDVSAMLVPSDGYWHSGPLSSNVMACPNARACRSANRSANLAAAQTRLLSNNTKSSRRALLETADATTSPAEPYALLEQLQQYRQLQCAEVRFCAACHPARHLARESVCVCVQAWAWA